MSTSKPEVQPRDWPQASDFKRSIRWEFTLYVSAIILFLMVVTGYIISRQYVETVTKNVVDKLLVQARSYSGPAGKLMLSTDGPDALLLNNICKKLSSDNSDVFWAGITGKDEVFLAHTDIRQVVTSARTRPTYSNQFSDMLRPEEGFDLSQDTIFITVPIKEGNIILAKLAVAASAKPIQKARTTSRLTVAFITVVMIFLGMPITIVLLHRKLRPLSLITDRLKNVNFENISFDIPLTSKNEFGYLAETIQVMGFKLNLAQKDLIEKERISRELEIAREIQANILPKSYPQGAEFELAGTYRSAKQVGGDYYDFIDFDDHRLGILVADVSGKSLPGMLVMLLTRDIVKRLARSTRSPSELLSGVNSELLGNIKRGMFVTMFLGILDSRTGRFSFASAGHNPLIWLKADTGKTDLIKTKGFPLGMVESKIFEKRMESGELILGKNDWLIQYTDGINEAQNSKGEEFGLDRFAQIIESCKNLTPVQFVGELLRKHEQFVGNAEQYDDITLLSIKWKGRSPDKKDMISQERVNACKD
jgi:serine phosphatase RsbU (regulator of sigma subunit)